MNDFYVYQHLKADNNAIFYVGKGIDRRAFKKCGRSQYWQRVANKHGVKIEFVAKGLDEELAFLCEKETIDVYKRRGFNLVNHSSGGEGNFNPSYETRLKMSLAKKGKPSPRKGLVMSEEQKLKVSLSSKQVPRRALRKLNNDQVKEIRALKGVLSSQKVADKFNVTKNVIYGIFNNLTYVKD